jgi:hypothetical protein
MRTRPRTLVPHAVHRYTHVGTHINAYTYVKNTYISVYAPVPLLIRKYEGICIYEYINIYIFIYA